MDLMTYRDSEEREHPIRNLQDWSRRRARILANMELVMGPLPGQDRKVPLEMEIVQTENLPGVVRKKITYASEKGHRVPAYLLLPNGRKGPFAGVLSLHGTSGGRGRTAGVGADYPPYTLELAQRGCVTIAPDYVTLGDKPGGSGQFRLYQRNHEGHLGPYSRRRPPPGPAGGGPWPHRVPRPLPGRAQRPLLGRL